MSGDGDAARLHEVLEYEDRRRAAIVKRDLDELENLLAPDMAYVHSNGMVDTRDIYLGIVRDHTFHSIEHEFITNRVYADVAILTAITTIDARKNSDGTVLAGSIRTINVWERQGDVWRQVHWQASKVSADH